MQKTILSNGQPPLAAEAADAAPDLPLYCCDSVVSGWNSCGECGAAVMAVAFDGVVSATAAGGAGLVSE